MEEEFEKSFNEIYDKLYSKCNEQLKEAKNKINTFTLTVAAVLILIITIIYMSGQPNYICVIAGCISFCVVLILFIVGNFQYKSLYKQCVIQGLVKGYNEKYYYTQKPGITSTEYNMSDFDRNYNEFYSEDKIYGRLDDGANFQVSEVSTVVITRHTDENGNVSETRTETFRGFYGVVRLNDNLLTKIHIANNSFLRKYNKNRVEVDSAEFEKYYDCLTDDKIATMRVFTPDLIEKYISIARDITSWFELKIIDNMMYFRFKTSKLFEPPVISTGLSREFLKEYYRVIYFPLEIVKATAEGINFVKENNE